MIILPLLEKKFKNTQKYFQNNGSSGRALFSILSMLCPIISRDDSRRSRVDLNVMACCTTRTVWMITVTNTISTVNNFYTVTLENRFVANAFISWAHCLWFMMLREYLGFKFRNRPGKLSTSQRFQVIKNISETTVYEL